MHNSAFVKVAVGERAGIYLLCFPLAEVAIVTVFGVAEDAACIYNAKTGQIWSFLSYKVLKIVNISVIVVE